MTINQVKQALGSWTIFLREDTPRELLDSIEPFGHIVVMPGRTDVRVAGDGLLSAARYVGVFRGRADGDLFQLRGCGMEFWLGDEDGKGDVYETTISASADTFADTIRSLLPAGGSVTEGTLYSVPGTFTGTFRFQDPRKAITYVTDTYSTDTFPVSWRVNGDGTLDAGRDEDMFVTTPTAMVVRRDAGRDPNLVGFAGNLTLDKDVEDYTTKVILLAEGEGNAIVTASASQATPYNDIHGNDVVFTRLISESTTDTTNAEARAQLQLNRFKNPRYNLNLSTAAYDVVGDFVVGDRIWVFDPTSGFTDSDNEVYWRGMPINPIALKVQEMTWPVPEGWTVAFRRSSDGAWIDLSDHYRPESGSTSIVVGEFGRSLTGITGEPVGTRPSADTSTPATPVFTATDSVAYQSQQANDTRAALYLAWNEPLNEDGSTVLDGDHYEIRIRATETFSYQIPWNRADDFTWDELQTWGRPLSNDAAEANQWKTYYVGWGTEQLTIAELMVASEYEIQIRAVDNANPPNQSAWSASTFHVTRTDTLAPEQPSAPLVASNPISIQVIHDLGAASGGSFNLARDLHHLEVHVGGPSFFPDESTHVGNINANESNLQAQIAVVQTFVIPDTSDIWVKVVAVDRFGNKSSPSDAVQSTISLINSEHISELTASKITAGTISASLLLSGSIKTAETGQRAELNSAGLQLYDADDNLTVNLTADDDTPNFIAITDGLQNTLAAIDSEGNVSGQTVTAAEDVVIAGSSFLTDYYSPLPKGMVARGFSDDSLTVIQNETKGYLELSFTAEEGRIYQVGVTGQYDFSVSSAAGPRFLWDIRDGGADTPTISSPEIASSWLLCNPTGNLNSGGIIIATQEFTPGLHRLLWTVTGGAIAGTYGLRGTDDRSYFWIEDKGDASLVPNTAVPNDGGGGGASAPVNYTTTYTGTWYQTYKGDNTQKSDTTANQGQFSSSDGNQRSLIGFDYAKIQSDLSGATINSIKVTLYAEHWYLDAGGTAVIGTHNYTSKPSTWTDSRVNQNLVQSSGWPKPGKRTVTLTAAIGTAFQSGTATGIALGPGPTTSNVYYGKFSGTTASNTGNRPVLTISYSK